MTMRILAAEDNPLNQLVLQEILRAEKVALEIVGNGADAVQATRCADFDAILMDIEMPIMDGLTAIREIRRDEAANPLKAAVLIVALSAHVDAADAAASLAAGADAHVCKPIDVNELLAVLAGARNDVVTTVLK